MASAITVENLSKRYIIGHQKQERYTALRDVLTDGVKATGRRLLRHFNPSIAPSPYSAREEFWALKDVGFDVQQGDRVGIIGRNGAGKSTLLKVLSRIIEPTTGQVRIRGRVASLLEVGTGFHPELTGRENIFLNGAILGMSRVEIKKKFDEIVAFADVEKFLDTPVKRYSSGMYVRLAFAVAAHLDPEILLVDEVLAVGDAEFQKKCLSRMDDVSENGKTILFVSHNFAAVQRLCNVGIFLHAGRIELQSSIESVLEAYQSSMAGGDDSANGSIEVKSGEARITSWRLIEPATGSPHACYSRDICEFEFVLVAKRTVENAFFGFAIWNAEGHLMIAASSLDHGSRHVPVQPGLHRLMFKVRLPLKAGRYGLDVSLNSPDGGQLDRWSAYPKLTVLPNLQTNLPDHWHGLLNEEVQFRFAGDPLRE